LLKARVWQQKMTFKVLSVFYLSVKTGIAVLGQDRFDFML
jgi:hypothetical protein